MTSVAKVRKILPFPISPDDAAADIFSALRAEAAEVDLKGTFPVRSIGMLAQKGLLAAAMDPRDAAVSLVEPASLTTLLRVLCHLGRASLPVGRIYEGHVNALLLIKAYGSAEQLARYADDAACGHLFAVWNTEAGDGVTMQRRGRNWRLAGRKTFATGVGHVSRALITSTDTDGERRMLVVPTDVKPPAMDPSFWQPLGMRPTSSFAASFDGIAVDDDAMIGRPGDYYREPIFSTGAIRFLAVQVGGAEAVLDETRGFLRRTGHADDPYQRARAAEMAALVQSARHWLAHAPTALRQTAPTDDGNAALSPIAFTNLARLSIEDACVRVLRLSERSIGARGLLRPEAFERLHRDLTHYLCQAAPDAATDAAGKFLLGCDLSVHALWPTAIDAR